MEAAVRRYSSTSGMHFEMRIFAKFIDLDQSLFSYAEPFQSLSLFGAAIPAGPPCGTYHGLDLVPRHAVPQRSPYIHAVFGIETQIPQTVRREPASIAGGTERHRGGRNDAER